MLSSPISMSREVNTRTQSTTMGMTCISSEWIFVFAIHQVSSSQRPSPSVNLCPSRQGKGFSSGQSHCVNNVGSFCYNSPPEGESLMKQNLWFAAAVILLSHACFGAPAILTGRCTSTTPNNRTTSAYLLGLGNNSTNGGLCWGGIGAYDDGSPLPSSGLLRNLVVRGRYTDGGSSPATWLVDVQVRVNRAVTLTCTATLSGGTATQKSVRCADHLHTVSVHAGDVVTVEMSTPGLICTNTSCPGIALHAALEKQ